MQKVNLLDEVEGIWRAFTRILSYLYTNIIYIKYNIKIAIFFFLSEVIPDTFLQSLTHCRQCLPPKLCANAVLFIPLCITSPFLHKYNPPLNRLLPFCQSSATFLLQNLQHRSIHCRAIYQDVASKSVVNELGKSKRLIKKEATAWSSSQ